MKKYGYNFLIFLTIALASCYCIADLSIYYTVCLSIVLGFAGSMAIEKLPRYYKKLSTEEILIPKIITYLTIAVLIVTGVMIPDYFKPVKYVYSNLVFYNVLATNNSGTVSNTTKSCRLEVALSTKQAYVPAQPIIASITWSIPRELSAMFDNSELRVYFYRSKASNTRVLPDNAVKFINLKDTALKMVDDVINIDLQKDGIVTLTRINDTLFAGESEIFYNSPGQYPYLLFDHYQAIMESEELLSIGSTVDLSMVKNNRIVLLLTFYAIALTFVLAFKK